MRSKRRPASRPWTRWPHALCTVLVLSMPLRLCAEATSPGCARLQANPVSVSVASVSIPLTRQTLITAEFAAGETLALGVSYANSLVRVLFVQQVLVDIPPAVPNNGFTRRQAEIAFTVPADGTASIVLEFAGGFDSGRDIRTFDEQGNFNGLAPTPYTDTVGVVLSCAATPRGSTAALGRTADRMVDLAFDTSGAFERFLGLAPAALFAADGPSAATSWPAIAANAWQWEALPSAGGAQFTGTRRLERDTALWLDGAYEGGHDDRGNSGLSKSGYSVIVGIGRRLGRRLALGLVGRYRSSRIDSVPLATLLEVDGVTAGAFLAVRPFSAHDTRWTTLVTYERANADFSLSGQSDDIDVQLWNVASRIGHRMQLDTWWFEPALSLEAAQVKRGAFALDVAAVSASTRWRGNAGGGGRIGTSFRHPLAGIDELSLFGGAEGLWHFAEGSAGLQADGTVLSRYGSGARFVFGTTLRLRSIGELGIDAGYQFAGQDTAQYNVGGAITIPY